MENNWLFQAILKKKFKSVAGMNYFGNMKVNIARISQKIEEENGNLGVLTDMIRGTIVVNNADQLLKAYKMVKETKYVEIIRIKNALLRPPFSTIFLNVIFKDNIVGEIQIRHGEKSVAYESNHFFYELERSNNFFDFRQLIFKLVN